MNTHYLVGHNIKAKLSELSLGDNEMEHTLSQLYYRSFMELSDNYAEALNNKDKELIRFIDHKYKSTFHLLDLPNLAQEVADGRRMVVEEEAEISTQASVVKVRNMCNFLADQIKMYYPALSKGIDT